MANTVRIDTQLNQIHEEVMSRLQLRDRANRDDIRALEIQNFLYRVKNLGVNMPTNSVDAALDEQAKILINQSLAILNKNRDSLHQLSGSRLFRRPHGTSTSYGGDDIFEEELAAVIASIESQATGQEASIITKLMGSNVANVNLQNEVISKDVQKIMEKFIKQSSSRIQTELLNSTKHYIGPVARAGKVDVQGTSMVDISANLHPDWQHLFLLLQGCNFSVKNYSSFHEGLNIHLGNSDYFKALYGALSSLTHYDKSEIESIIYRGLYRYSQGNENVGKHIYHLRFIYELTGVGLYDETGSPISGVDFIIYNDPNSTNIFVKSTARLILEELESKWIKGSALKGIAVGKHRFETN